MNVVSGSAVDLRSLRKLSRAISIVENAEAGWESLLSDAYRAGPRAQVIGVTGPPGAGKSTLIDALVEHWANAGNSVAVLAVDPSSPHSGGAVLGDRVRMERSSGLPGVYCRSVSARGQNDGLSAAVCDILALLNGAGFGRIVLETVGAGQADIAVAEAAECTVVVGVPGLGDQVQASKAGLMEVGDIYVINKADRPGAKETAAGIDGALGAAYAGEPGVNQGPADRDSGLPSASPGRRALVKRHGDPGQNSAYWRPPVHLVSAASGEGIPTLAASVDSFFGWCAGSARLDERRRARFKAQVVRGLATALVAPYQSGAGSDALGAWVERILSGEASPPEAVLGLLRREEGSD